jgi:hypothetical protein
VSVTSGGKPQLRRAGVSNEIAERPGVTGVGDNQSQAARKSLIAKAGRMPELPIVCTLTPEALRARRQGLLMDVARRAERREDLPDGLRLQFAPSGDTIALIARAVDAERHCCRFLRFGITVEPDGGPVFLDLTGPSGTRDFVNTLLEM